MLLLVQLRLSKSFLIIVYNESVESIRKLCTPAYVYLVISAISIILMMFQNAGATNKYCVGMFECQASNIPAIFVMKVIYVAFWTFVLDSICKAGHKRIAWFILLCLSSCFSPSLV